MNFREMEIKEEYRDVVVCMYFVEMRVDETVRELAVPPGTVKSRLSRARAALKEILERRGLG